MGATLSLCVSLVCPELCPLLGLGRGAGSCLCHPSAGRFGVFLALLPCRSHPEWPPGLPVSLR